MDSTRDSVLQSHRSRQRRVKFFPEVEVFHFRRQEAGDKIPDDFLDNLSTTSLGMEPHHSWQSVQPLEVPWRSQDGSAWLSAEDRQELLREATPLSAMDSFLIELENLSICGSRRSNGCSCKGRCLPETCFCSKSGIPCNSRRRHGMHGCSCSARDCQNPEGSSAYNSTAVKEHRRKVLSRMSP